MERLIKPFDSEKNEALMKEVKDYLRANAKQVKFFEIDHLFTGKITVTERQDYKAKPGYKQKQIKFRDFEDLKKHYGHQESEVSEPVKKPAKRVRGKSASSNGSVKNEMAE